MSYIISISFVLVTLYLLLRNRQYTLPLDKMLFKILFYEILATILVSILSFFLENPINTLFPPHSLANLLGENFLAVAPFEELAKFIPVYLATHRFKKLRHKEDVVLYLIFSSCIFSTIENLLYTYIYDGDYALAFLRNFVSTPCHLFYSIIFGFFCMLYLQHSTYKWGYLLQGLFFSSFFHAFMNFCLCFYSFTTSFLGLIFASIALCTFYFLGFTLLKRHLEKAIHTIQLLETEEASL
ncbi:MAG: PrsW family glutamic-type intramembrane protease [Niameybacter sp.]